MRGKLPLLLLLGVALLYAALLALAPAPEDWRPDYEGDSARPLGADVFFELLPRWLAPEGGEAVRVIAVEAPPYLHLERPRGDTTYLFLTSDFAPDEAEAARLLAHARGGATVFVATRDLGGVLVDSLGRWSPRKLDDYSRHGLYVDWRGLSAEGSDSLLYLTAPGLARAGGYRFPLSVTTHVLAGLDPARTTVLATRADGEPVVARVRHGRGAFVLASAPEAFSNAALVGVDGEETDGPAFVAGVLRYVPAGPAFWDERYKPRRGQNGGSPLRYVLSRPPLRWAYFLSAFGVVAFVLFRGRRWQRPVPVVAPPPNAAVEFTRTLGRLYFQHGDHGALAERKARYFTDRLRTRLGLAEATLSEETEARAVRRGVPDDIAADAFGRLRQFRDRRATSAEELVALDRALDRFFEAAG